jgi:hypothetical protein
MYEELLAGKQITLTADKESITRLAAQLRTTKSRYDKKYKALAGVGTAPGKVIRADVQEDGSYLIYLGDPKKQYAAIEFTIITIATTDSENEKIL